jgi:hypothetical protein
MRRIIRPIYYYKLYVYFRGIRHIQRYIIFHHRKYFIAKWRELGANIGENRRDSTHVY